MNNYKIDSIGAYHQGVAIFKSGELFGVVLTGGNVLLPPQYDYIGSFNNGYAQAIRGGCCLVIDLSGKEYKALGDSLVPLAFKYDFIREFNDGLACVKVDDQWGVIDTSGNELFHSSFDYIADFEFGVAKCLKSQEQGNVSWGIVNSDGEFFELDSEPIIGSDGIITFYRDEFYVVEGMRYRRNGEYVRIDKKGCFAPKNEEGTSILQLTIDSYNIVRNFHCGLSCAQNNDGYWGIIDTLGRIIVPFEYLSISDYSENRSFAKDKKGNHVLLSEKGTVIKYLEGISDHKPFLHNVAIVYKETRDFRSIDTHGSCGMINKEGELILDYFKGEIIATNDPNVFTLKTEPSKKYDDNKEKVGYFNTVTHLLIKPQYDEIVRFEHDYVVVRVQDLYECKISYDGHPFVFNGDERVLLPEWCIGGEDFQSGICKALGDNRKWGLVDKDGTTICEPKYDSIGDVNENHVTLIGRRVIEVKDSNSWYGTKKETIPSYGLVNLDDKVVISANYDKVPEWNGCFYLVTSDNKIGIVDPQGHVVVDPKYISVDKFGEYFLVKQLFDTTIQCGILSNEGKEIISPAYYAIELLKPGFFKGRVNESTNHDEWYLLNENGKLSKRPYDEIVIEGTEYFRFKLANKEGLLDLEGNIVVRKEDGEFVTVPSEFAWCSDFKDGYASALIRDYENFVDEHFSIIIVSENKLIHPDIPIDYAVGKDPEGNIIYETDYKFGLMSGSGKSIIPAEYHSIRYLSKGCYVVSHNSYPYKYGVIGYDGTVITPFEYDEMDPFSGDIQFEYRHSEDYLECDKKETRFEDKVSIEFWYTVKRGERWNSLICYGLIGLSGKILLDAKYEAIHQCSFGFFLKESGKWRAYDKSFSLLGDRAYDSFSETENGYYKVTAVDKNWGSVTKKIGVLDPWGNEKLSPDYSSIVVLKTSNLALICKSDWPHLYGIVNKDYDILLEPQFESVSGFNEGVCIALKTIGEETIKGTIDVDGNYTELSRSTKKERTNYDDSSISTLPEVEREIVVVLQLDNGLTIIKTTDSGPGYYSIEDSSGKVLLPFKYHGIEPLDNGSYRVVINPTIGIYGRHYGILNNKLEEILEPIYHKIEPIGEKYLVCKDFRYGLADTSGGFIIPCEYEKIEKASDHLFWLYENRLYGLADDKGEFIIQPIFAEVKNFKDGFACVLGGGYWEQDYDDDSWKYHDGHWGAIDFEGNEVVPLVYDSIEYEQPLSLFRVSKAIRLYGLDSNTFDSETTVFGYINAEGVRVIKGVNGDYVNADTSYDWQDDYSSDGKSTVYYSGQKGVVNEQGQFLVHYHVDDELKEAYLPSGFFWGYDSKTPFIIVIKDGKQGLFSIDQNNFLIDPQYDELCPLEVEYSGGLLYKCITYCEDESLSSCYGRQNRIGIVTESGLSLLPQEYVGIEHLAYSLVLLQREDGQYMVFNVGTSSLLPDSYEEVLPFGKRDDYHYYGAESIIKNSKLAVVKKHGKYGAINDFGELVVPIKYHSLSLKDNDLLESDGVLLDNLGRIVVSNGNMTIPLVGDYESASLLENNLIIAKHGGLWGCVSLTGEVIVPFIYNSIREAGGYFIVSQKSHDNETIEYGVIDIRAKSVIPFTDAEEIEYDNKVFIYKKDNMFGAFSENGVSICVASYDKIEGMNDFLIKVGKECIEYFAGEDSYYEQTVIKWGLISFDGEEIQPCVYNEIEPFENSSFIRIKQGKYFGLLDAAGTMVLEPKYFEIGDFVDSFSIVLGRITAFNKSGKKVDAKAYGVIDGSMKEVIPCCFSLIEYEKETGRFKTNKGYKLRDGRFVCVFGDRQILIPSKYIYCGDFVDDRAVAFLLKNPGYKYGLIDVDAQDVFPPIFDSLLLIGKGLYRFKLNDLYGIVDSNGKIILDNQYASIGKFNDGLAVVCINQGVPNKNRILKGLCDVKGDFILPTLYEYMGKETGGYRNLARKGEWFIFNSKTYELTLVPNVSYLGFCHGGRFIINVGGKFVPGESKTASGGNWGFVDENANMVVAADYDEVRDFKKERAIVKLQGKWGVIDINGKTIVPFDYDVVFSDYTGECCELGLNGTVHVFAMDGDEVNNYPYPKSYYDDDYYDEPDDFNYEEEAWYYMTGGQYGDYPGGSIDYDFLGF